MRLRGPASIRRLRQGRLGLQVRRARGPFLVLMALVVLAIGAASVIVSRMHLSLPWQHPYTVEVAVDDAKGVVAGKQEVRISGVPVGRITGVKLVAGRPVLTLQIENRYSPLYRNATLRLRPKTPLNDLYMNVDARGDASAGKLEDGEILPAEQTTAPVDIGRVLNSLNADVRVRVKEAIDELGRTLPDHGKQLRAAIVEMSPFLDAARRLTKVLAERRADTASLVHNFSLMTEELGRRDRDLSRLVSGGAATFSALGENDQSVRRLIAELPPTLRQLDASFATVRSTANRLDPAFDSLRPTARALPAGLGALRSFSVEAEPTLAALRGPLPSLTSLVDRLQPTANRLSGALSKLGPQVPRLDRMTGQLVPCRLAVQKFFQNTISVLKFSDARGANPRGHIVAGVKSAGGVVNDPTHTPSPSCAPGGPRK